MMPTGVPRPYSPGAMGGIPVNALAPAAPFTPQDYDSSLVHLARGEALHAITYAHATPDGFLLAWQATVSFAEALMPMASTDLKGGFIKAYTSLVVWASKNKRYPTRALWRICSLEMKRQGRLGEDKSLPMDKERFGLEPSE